MHITKFAANIFCWTDECCDMLFHGTVRIKVGIFPAFYRLARLAMACVGLCDAS
jgi:hypothetical protein